MDNEEKRLRQDMREGLLSTDAVILFAKKFGSRHEMLCVLEGWHYATNLSGAKSAKELKLTGDDLLFFDAGFKSYKSHRKAASA